MFEEASGQLQQEFRQVLFNNVVWNLSRRPWLMSLGSLRFLFYTISEKHHFQQYSVPSLYAGLVHPWNSETHRRVPSVESHRDLFQQRLGSSYVQTLVSQACFEIQRDIDESLCGCMLCARAEISSNSFLFHSVACFYHLILTRCLAWWCDFFIK